MTTYATLNPIGSQDPRDLYDNAENLDNFINGTEDNYDDRFGVERRSYEGVVNAFDGPLQTATQQADRAEEQADLSEASRIASEAAAFQSVQSASISEGFAGQAQVAAEASGNVLFFDTYAEADAATLSDGQVVEVFTDEQQYGRNTRYRFESGALIYKPRNQSYSDSPGFGHSKYIYENPLYADDSNYLLIGPDIYIENGVNFVIPQNTDVTITNGTEFNPNV